MKIALTGTSEGPGVKLGTGIVSQTEVENTNKTLKLQLRTRSLADELKRPNPSIRKSLTKLKNIDEFISEVDEERVFIRPPCTNCGNYLGTERVCGCEGRHQIHHNSEFISGHHLAHISKSKEKGERNKRYSHHIYECNQPSRRTDSRHIVPTNGRAEPEEYYTIHPETNHIENTRTSHTRRQIVKTNGNADQEAYFTFNSDNRTESPQKTHSRIKHTVKTNGHSEAEYHTPPDETFVTKDFDRNYSQNYVSKSKPEYSNNQNQFSPKNQQGRTQTNSRHTVKTTRNHEPDYQKIPVIPVVTKNFDSKYSVRNTPQLPPSPPKTSIKPTLSYTKHNIQQKIHRRTNESDAEIIRIRGGVDRGFYLQLGGDARLKSQLKTLQNESELDQLACYSFQFVVSSCLSFISRPLLAEILDYLLTLHCNDDRFYTRTLKIINALQNDSKSIRYLVDNDIIMKVMRLCGNPSLQSKCLDVLVILTAELSSELGERQVFNYFWDIFMDELEKKESNPQHLSVCISILSNLMSQRDSDLYRHLIMEGKIEKLVECALKLEKSKSGIIPALGALCILCYDNKLDGEARQKCKPVFPLLIRLIEKYRKRQSRQNLEENAILKVSLVLLKALVSDIQLREGPYVTRLIADTYIDAANTLIELDQEECQNCKIINEIIESSLGILHILSRNEQNCDVLVNSPNFLRTLSIKESVGVGLHSIDPNLIRHSVAILYEMSKYSKNLKIIHHLTEIIWEILCHTITESTAHYASICLYNIAPREYEEKIEERLFLNETKVNFGKGILKEKWIQRILNKKPKAKKIEVQREVKKEVKFEQSGQMDYGIEAQVEQKTEIRLIDVQWGCSFEGSSNTDNFRNPSYVKK